MATCWARVTSKDSDLLLQSCAVPWIAHAWLMSTASLPRPSLLGLGPPPWFPLALATDGPNCVKAPLQDGRPAHPCCASGSLSPSSPFGFRLPFPCGLPSTGATDGPCCVGDHSPRIHCRCCALGRPFPTSALGFRSSSVAGLPHGPLRSLAVLESNCRLSATSVNVAP